MQRHDTHVQLHQWVEFGVSSSKFYKLEGPHIDKVFPFWNVLLVPFSIRNRNGTCPPITAISPRDLRCVWSMVCPAALKELKEVQIECTCPARALCTQCHIAF